jgi:L-fucose isomerase-like protein
MDKKTTFGLIVGNRGFFPDHLVMKGRKKLIDLFTKKGYELVYLPEDATKFGSVESLEDAQKCGKLFFDNKDKIDGIIVTLPNFGDERAVANTIKYSTLDVPILIHAFPDDAKEMSFENRRDSFCGKISVCNNLIQYKKKFSLTTLHTEDPDTNTFNDDIEWFAAVCRIVKGLKNARVGAIGARTGAFNTVRFSEKLLENSGISTETIDLSEIIGRTGKIKDSDDIVKNKLEQIKNYISIKDIPEVPLIRMAKFYHVVEEWIKTNNLNTTAIQCWTALEDYFGIVPCSIMSIMSENLLPSACEVDVPGAISMYAMQLASGTPSALLDWNNNYGDDPNKTVFFHCSNLPKSFFDEVQMQYQEIISTTVGKENTYGACVGRMKPGAITYTRITTDDTYGEIRAYVGEGEITNDPMNTFGGYGVCKINNLQDLMKYICYNGFEHHVALNRSQVSEAIFEAFDNYLDWDVYLHE